MKSIMKSIHTLFALCAVMLACTVLDGCSTIGLAPAQSFDQQLAYGYGTVASVRTTAASALNAGAITTTDAQQVLTVTDTARATLDVAGTASKAGDVNTAMGKLQIATSLLSQIQQYLSTKGVK